MKSRISIFLFLVFSQLSLQAQYGSLSGLINDSEGKPAAFVNVLLNETKQNASSNEEGIFQFEKIVPGEYTMVASFVGYKNLTQKIKIEDGKTLNLELELIENAELLKEIVVKGYLSQNERITAIGKMDVKVMDLPIAIQAIDNYVLETQQVQNLSDVLMNTNGVYIMGTTGGYQEEIAGRGFQYRSSNTFKNGTRFNNSIMTETSGLERVEVLKGSGAMLYGNVAAGGILNLITKKPKFDFGGEVSYRTGSFGLSKPSFDFYGGLGKGQNAAFRLNGTYQKAESFRQFVSSERFYINPSLLFKFGNNTDLLLEGDYIDDQRTPDFGSGVINYEVVENYPRNRYLGVRWANVNAKQMTSSATLTHQWNQFWKSDLNVSIRKSEQNLFSTTRPNTSGNLIGADGLWVRSLQKFDSNENYGIVQGNMNGQFKTGSIKHQVLIGFDAEKFNDQRQAYNNFSRYDTLNIFNDLPANSRYDIPSLSNGNYTDNITQRYGIYAQDLITLNNSFKLLAGLRYSRQGSINKLWNPAQELTETETPSQGAFSPRLGLVFQPSEKQSIFFSYSNSFELNSGVDIDGKALEPSIIDQFEIGLKNNLLNDKLTANITLYQIDNANLAQMSLVNNNTYTYVQELAGHVRSKGVELDLAARPLPGWSILAGYSYNQTKYVSSNIYIEGSFLRYNPNHTANASTQYQFLSGSLHGLNLGLAAVYIGKRYAGRSTRLNVENDDRKIIPIDAYGQVDLTAGYDFKRISLKGKLANLTNTLSYNVHDDNSLNPISPRNFLLSAAFRF